MVLALRLASAHPRKSCHGFLALVVLAGFVAGCASSHGWSRTDARACAPAGPPRLCLKADPDLPLLMRVGDTVVVPGECMVAAKRGGSLKVHVEDGRDKHVYEGRVAVRRGQTTTVMLDEQQGSLTDARTKCRQTPIDSPFVAREPGD